MIYLGSDGRGVVGGDGGVAPALLGGEGGLEGGRGGVRTGEDGLKLARLALNCLHILCTQQVTNNTNGPQNTKRAFGPQKIQRSALLFFCGFL